MNNSQVINIGAPINPSDAATKSYVDAAAGGGGGLGVGQTWQDMTVPRQFGTFKNEHVYKNDTGKPIQVSAMWESWAGGANTAGNGEAWVGSGPAPDIMVSRGSSVSVRTIAQMSFIVPDQHFYSVNKTGGQFSEFEWVELR